MKNVLMIALFCLILFAGQSVFAQTDAPSENKPTFEETMNWLQKNFADYAQDDNVDCHTFIEKYDQKSLTIRRKTFFNNIYLPSSLERS